MRGRAALHILAATSGAALAGSAEAQDYVPYEVICKPAPDHTIEEINRWYGTVTHAWIPGTRLYLLGAYDVVDIEAYADSMEASYLIESADPNYYATSPEAARQMPLAAVGGTLVDYEDQEMVDRIGLASAHQVSRGAGTTVAVLDTGVDLHVHLAPSLLQGFDFVDDDASPREEAGGLDEDGDGVTDDGYGHGTMVAGIVSLVAPEAMILPIRVLDDEGVGTAWDAIEGVHFAIESGADVINLSFGTPAEIPLLTEQLERAHDARIVVVAAAGNQSTDLMPYYPAASPTAIMITALDSTDVKADFADWHALVGVSAPGTGIRSTYPGDGWALGSGCSFAAPIVAGEVALLSATTPRASVETLTARLSAAVADIYALPGNASFVGALGTGRVDVGAALTVVGVEPAAVDAARELRLHPNPSAGRVHLRLGDATAGFALLRIYSARGRLVRTLPIEGDESVWDGTDARGRAVPSGVYYLEVAGGGADRLRAPVRLVR